MQKSKKSKLTLDQATTPTKVKRGPGRPKKGATEQVGDTKVDLLALKQTFLLDDLDKHLEKQVEVEDVGVRALRIPYTPSSHQQEVHELLAKHRFGVVVVHRSWGKSWLAINELIRRAWECKARNGGKFVYIAPEKLQAKNIIWQELKNFTEDLPRKVNESELTLTFPNGSTIQLAGSDNPDRLRGQHLHFVVMDEVAQMPANTWYEAVYPSLRAHKGGALFIGTPKGENLFTELFDYAVKPEAVSWFGYWRSIEETSVATEEEIKELRATMPADAFEQELMCSRGAKSRGAYYAHILKDPENEIVRNVPYDPSLPVYTGWDLGTTDPTVVWFAQRDRKDPKIIRIIDYYEKAGSDFFTHIRAILSKPYKYAKHIVPHDIRQVSWSSGRNREDVLRNHNMEYTVAPKVKQKVDGIHAAQALLYMSVIDEDKCQEGVQHLVEFISKRDRMTGEYTGEPSKSPHRHASDALATLATGMRDAPTSSRYAYAVADYDYLNPTLVGREDPNSAGDNDYNIWEPALSGSKFR